MRILITGNLGYIGQVLSTFLNKNLPKAILVGIDNNYFYSHNIIKNNNKIIQIYDDIRKIKKDFLKQFDCVVHLAAISNDPIGEKFKEVTREINYFYTKKLFKNCLKANVKNFIFASSCSLYGNANPSKFVDENFPQKPLSEYAKSKVNFEKLLKKNKDKIKITSLRFSTACGFSPALRLDLVLNEFVFTAINNKKIILKSSGTSHRPFVHVEDMSRAILWAIERKSKTAQFVNIGHNKNNYTILELAKIVQNKIKGTKIILNPNSKQDPRSYKVSFNLYNKVKLKYRPKFMIGKIIDDLKKNIINHGITTKFIKQKSNLVRLKELICLYKKNKVDRRLNWTNI